MPERVNTWTCGRCGVVSRFEDADAGPPKRWERRDGGWRCLGCLRAELGDDPDALAEFELRADPKRTDSEIVARTGLTRPAVSKARARLGEERS